MDEPGGAIERLVVRKQRSDERLEIAVSEVLADIDHAVDDLAALEKEGLERELQELLADAPHWCGEGFRLVRREWPTDIGPVDLMCRDTEDEWVAVEIKRIATMDSVRAAHPLPGAHPPGPRDGVAAGACSSPSGSSPRRACWPLRAASTASRSTSRSCAATASPS